MFEVSDRNEGRDDVSPEGIGDDAGLGWQGEGVRASGPGGNDINDDPDELVVTTTDNSGATIMMRVKGADGVEYTDRIGEGHVARPPQGRTLFFGSVGNLTIGGPDQMPDPTDETPDPEDR